MDKTEKFTAKRALADEGTKQGTQNLMETGQ